MEFTVKIESSNSVVTLPECFQMVRTQILSDTSLFFLQTTKTIVFWTGNLSPFPSENMLCAHLDPATA